MAVKSGKVIIDALNEVLSGELAAINQYFLHAKMFENWGYKRLYGKVYAESIDEMKHADSLIARILYLDGVPNVQRLGRVRIGETPREMFEADRALEVEARLLGQGRHAEAERQYRELVETRHRISGPDHPWTVSALHGHGLQLLALERYDEANQQLTLALERERRLMGAQHADALACERSLVRLRLAEGRSEDALRMVERNVAGLDEVRVRIRQGGL